MDTLQPMKLPDILAVLTDPQRVDCPGCVGNTQLQMRNLDNLACDSVHLANTFCAYPVCTPSRYSLLSGLPARSHVG